MLLISIPGEVTNGEGEWDPRQNPNQSNVMKHRIMKWVGIQYGLQMDPEEPMGQEHNFGIDGLGENNQDDEPGNEYPVMHVPRSEEWWNGLRQRIIQRGTDNDGDVLSDETVRICNDERWWATFATLSRFVRIHLCMTIGQSLGNNKTNLTNFLANIYEYDQDVGNDGDQSEDNNERNEDNGPNQIEQEDNNNNESSQEAEWTDDENDNDE